MGGVVLRSPHEARGPDYAGPRALSPLGAGVGRYVPMTVVVAVALLLSGFGSLSFPLTVAVLVSAPGVVVVTTIVMLALAPFARPPCLHVMVPPFGAVVDRA